MKAKNIVFSGVMGAILMGATGANAAGPISVASRGYVDQQVAGVSKTVSDLDTAKANKASTLAGYGITDAYTAAEIDGKFETQVNAQAKLEAAQADAKQKFEAAQSYTREQIDALRDSLGGTGEDGESTGLTGAVAKNASDIVDLKTQVGEGKVADRISAALTEAKNDATTKANAAEQNAKDYADDGLALKEDKSNKVDVITEADKENTTKYASVKAVYDHVSAAKAELSLGASGLDTRLTAAEGDITKLFSEKADKTAVAQDIADAKAAAIADAAAKDTALKSDLEGQIATAKSEAETDATNKADAAKAGAEATASAALAAAVEALEAQIQTAGTGASGDLAAAKTELEAAIAKAQKDATDAASQDATTKAAAALASATQAVTSLADGAVKTNTDAIAAINNAETGILAQAKADAAAQAKAVSDRLKLLATADVPAECESESSMCVLSYNGTTYSWMPLTVPLEYNE